MAILTPAEIETRSLALLNSFAVLHFTAPNDSNGNPRNACRQPWPLPINF
jgi:hypothetical protein